MQAQRDAAITVVVGNPPWRAGQRDENEGNKNLRYELLDERIQNSYAARTTAQNKNSLYDSYIRAIRWATDRVGNQGVVAFVTNAGWIDGNAMDGMRKELADECAAIYVVNLRGNQRTQGELSRREGGKIFGSGSRAAVSLVVLVKDESHTGSAEIFYHDIGDYLSREEKLAKVKAFGDVQGVPWIRIMPNEAGDWIHQRSDEFASLMPLGGERTPISENQLFSIRSSGVKTNRDAWVYNFSREAVARNMERMIAYYNEQVDVLARTGDVDRSPKNIAWSGKLLDDARMQKRHKFETENIRLSLYRPFAKRWLYFDRSFNERVYQQPRLFPRPDAENRVIMVQGVGGARTFSCFITDTLPDIQMMSNGQCFPLYVYPVATPSSEEVQISYMDGNNKQVRAHGITDNAFKQFQQFYNDYSITKDDLFYYVYGVLHSSDYRKRFAMDLKRQLPRIPFASDFWTFSRAGRKLADLHIGYEAVEPYPLREIVSPSAPEDPWERYHVTKMTFNKNRTVLTVNEWITLQGIPQEAFEYQVNGRSPIEWVVDQYRVTKDSKSGIVNDPNDWARETAQNPRYIIDLAKRAVRVAVETVKIVKNLPPSL